MRLLVGERGSALLAVLAIFLALAILGTALVAATGGESRATARQVASAQALGLADAGIERAYSDLVAAGYELLSDGEGEGSPEILEMGTGKAVYRTEIRGDDYGNYLITITSTGVADNPHYMRTVEFKGLWGPLGIFNYAAISYAESERALFLSGHAVEIYGPIHANGGAKFAGGPKVYGTVTLVGESDGHTTSPGDDTEYIIVSESDELYEEDDFDKIWEALEEAEGEGTIDVWLPGDQDPTVMFVWTFDQWREAAEQDDREAMSEVGLVVYDGPGDLDYRGEYPPYVWVRDSSVRLVAQGQGGGPPGGGDDNGSDCDICGFDRGGDEGRVHPIFFVDEDVIIGGNEKVYASFYAKGDIEMSGNCELYGQLGALGDITFNGKNWEGDEDLVTAAISFKGWHRLGWTETGQHIGHHPD